MTRRDLLVLREQLLDQQHQLQVELLRVRREIVAVERRLDLTCHTRHNNPRREAIA